MYMNKIFNKVICPICKHETTDNYTICSVCGWEYDDNVNDEAYSYANKNTVAGYRKLFLKNM